MVEPDRWRVGRLLVSLLRIRVLVFCYYDGLGLPATVQSRPAVDQGPMTNEHLGSNPAPTAWAAKTQRVVIGRHGFSQPGRYASWFQKPEFCESFEHRSPPSPLCAAGQ